ncbi:serine/threonine-protein kinase, partial [Prosthecobacter sp.]|uniref:serine/threonine-protein kinase n=1 Tax=Prosthecobacter sp. TaxID=1965333 RepID=UPI003784074A
MSSELIHALPAGFCLHKYVIQRQIGYGNFGITYLAWDRSLERKVAIKEMLPQDFAARGPDRISVVAKSASHEGAFLWAKDRFLKEARTLAKLVHPSIVKVIEQFEANSTAYLVMEFIEGDDLEDWFRKTPRPSEKTLRALTIQILQALSIVHEQGYLHRDIKPGNIRMQMHASGPVPILIDFGNARMSTGLKTENLSQIVTYGFAPFEQYQKTGRQGAWTDLYALGAVLYQGTTGKVPPDAIERHGEDSILVLAREQGLNHYSTAFRAMIDKALRLSAKERWQTCTEWLRELDPTTVPPEPPRRRLLLIVTTLVALLALAGGGAVYLNGDNGKSSGGGGGII